jgi:hypothetical protein
MAQKEASDTNNENFITKLASYMASNVGNMSVNVAAQIIEQLSHAKPSMTGSEWQQTTKAWLSEGLIDSNTKKYLDDSISRFEPFAWLIQVILILFFYMKDIGNILDISSLDKQYADMAKAVPNPAPVQELVKSMMVDPARATENRKEMKKYGYDDTQIDNIILANYALYPESLIAVLYLRGVLSEEKMYERMRELGFTDIRTQEIIQSWSVIPGIQDLLMMVAHEAFEPDSIELMGLNDEFPIDQVEWMKKQGLSEDWARKYWIAHWNQPSIGQGYEMLHRGVIDKDTLELLYRTVEIPPFWRDKLTAVAYQPYTRVDVRRMHNLGIIDDQELIKAYMDLGYDGEHALNMANFTIKYNAETDEGISRSSILNSYHDKLMTRKEAKDLLTMQGLGEAYAEYYLTLEDYNISKETQDLQLKNISDRYLLGQINDTQLRNALNQSGFLSSKIDATIEALQLQKYQYERLPTKSDCDAWLIKGIIQENEYTSLLTQMGFSQRHIQQYLQDINNERIFKGRSPTKADLDRWIKSKYINSDQYSNYLKGLGYSDIIINLYLKDHGVK